jgi:hypothetical protein
MGDKEKRMKYLTLLALAFLGCQQSPVESVPSGNLNQPSSIQKVDSGGIPPPIPDSCGAESVRCVPSEYSTIALAIASASNGDLVLVAPGTYLEFNLNFLGKAITVKSMVGPSQTIIDSSSGPANGRDAFRFQNGESRSSVLEGFTITGGWLVGLG